MTEVSAQDWANRQRSARRAAGLSMRQLAERAGVSASLVSMLEAGYMASPKSRTMIAAALGYENAEQLYPAAAAAPAAAA